ncbi:SDR family NAD(P)-dependent oxidoreductase [Mycolicibacterium sp. CBMA 295]|uniref:SDR family NAD(P)-dependent oxidoreductase n=1 Tax=Mycolicibacterium sp. CBMA 295 TaxID=2606605 RepID=UPI0012DF25B6|nr:SDR family NAD(P)-dependent oxidoreductase [Mycolicibacterium sp. CBMA 295]MUM28234.1 SDR family oxidoreductase [Mycolicibacterium sp. CBMA 295]
MKRLEDRRILVTGAGSGIGQATALRLLEEGASVVGADISADGLEATRQRAQRARTAVEALGGLDAVVNAAGMLRAVHTHEMTLAAWNQIIAVNLTGTFLVIRETLPALLQNPQSAIVNFSSTSAAFAHPYMAAYAASKGGVQAMTHALALEYGKQGLRAVSVAPGSIKSGITDATPGLLPADSDWSLFAKLSPIMPTTLASGGAGMGDPSAVAGVIAMLVSDDGAFISGTEIRIDGGTHA